MFHLNFGQNQQDPYTDISKTRKLFNEIRHFEEKKNPETIEEQTVPATSSKENSYTEIKKDLMPDINEKKAENEPTSPSKQQLQQTANLPFIYNSSENIFSFEKISDDFVMKCPFLQK